MRFAYSARDPMGRVVEGELEATSQEQVARELQGRALTPRWIRALAVPVRGSHAASNTIPVESREPADLGPAGMGDAGEGDAEEEATGASRKSGCSPWSLILFLLFLSQILRAC